jgi:ABC-type bacteriocin/lantibiotic exporter with double-glycine peptidase domain
MAFTKINLLSRVTLFVKLESHDIYTIIYLIVGVGILNLATPVAIQALVNIVTMGGVLEPLYVISLILFILLTLSGVLYVLQAYLVEHIQRRFFVRTAIEAANNTQVSIGQEHSTQNTAELMNRFFDVSTIQKAAAQLLTNGLSSVLQAVIGSIVLMFYSFYFALIVLLMIFTLWFIVRVIGGRAIDTSIQESTTKYKVVAWLETISNNISAFKFLQGKYLSQKHIDTLALNYLDARKTHFNTLLKQNITGVVLYALAGTSMLALGGALVIEGQINLGQFVAAELIIFNVLSSFIRFIYQLEYFYVMTAAFDKIGKIQDLEKEKSGAYTSNHNEVSIHFKDVSYAYNDQLLGVNQLSFELPPKSTMAMLARSGSGKSTVAELLVGLKVPSSGFVQYNQVDIKQYDIDTLRQKVGYMRKLDIIEDSIANNIRFGREDITAAQITEVLGKLGILEVVLKLEENIDTPLSHTGAPLSFSQAKLLCLARNIISNPALLVIDGLLDDFETLTLDIVMKLLTAENRSWSLVVLTKHEHVAKYCERLMKLDSNGRWD